MHDGHHTARRRPELWDAGPLSSTPTCAVARTARTPAHMTESRQPPFDRIVFDCDSTLSSIEGIDVLGGEHRAEIEALTNAAMAGEVSLDSVYGKRLERIAPSRLQVATLGRTYVENALPGARELVAGLASLGKEVRIVSGGLHLAVVAFGQWLGLQSLHVHAVKIYFDEHSHYRAFEKTSPLARSGGKRELVQSWETKRTAFVGDGITDAEVRDVVSSFICFAGVVKRDEVAAQADAVIEEPNLAKLVDVLCTDAERARLARDPRQRNLVRLADLPA